RRIAALLVIACLGVAAPVTAALAQGAGDQQYQDPFGDSGSGSGSSGAGSSGSSGSKTQTNQGGSVEPLSPSPQTSSGSSSGSSGSGTSGSGTAATPTTTPQASRSLPNTGLDTRVLLLGGAALLILGLGLRLRSAPERF
ncbi:MAG: cell wall anchor protein, partial [Conexibacter sp.]|nr:cell wall anchor protein [Conexibacter sp.]